jgi:gluconolactonase
VPVLASGLRFPEAPAALADGGVLVAEIAAGRISWVDPGGGPNGLAFGPDRRLDCCNNGGFGFLYDDTGRLIPHAADWGRLDPANRPGDGRGGDPLHLRRRGAGARPERPRLRCARRLLVHRPRQDLRAEPQPHWRLLRARRRERGREAIFPLENPNGIGLSPDGATLYVAETFTCMLWAFDLDGPRRVVAAHKRLRYRPEGAKWFNS